MDFQISDIQPLLNKDEYVVVDVETTGLDPKDGCEIIEIGITEIKNNRIVRDYSRLIKPKGMIPSNITQLTGISEDMVRDALEIEGVLPNFRRFLGKRTLIAHNAKFDVGFLNFYLEKMGLEPISDYICTIELLKINKKYTAKSKKLKTACEFYQIINERAHRASSDTNATAQLFFKIREDMGYSL